MPQNRRRAVMCQCIIPLRVFIESIDLFQVIQKNTSNHLRFRFEPIQVHILVLEIRSQTDKVPLMSHHIQQFILLKKALHLRIPFPLFLSGLDGNADIPLIFKPKTHHRMRNQRRTPETQV